MSTTQTEVDQERVDLEAAARHFNEGTPFEPELARRIQERSQRISEETFERIGNIDVDKLIRETRDEA